MPIKFVNATELKEGSYAMIDDTPCVVRKIDTSKTGKHGAHKCRFEAVGMLSDKKKVFVVPGTDRFEIPMVEKRKGQVLSIGGDRVSIMDLENFETLELKCPEELKSELEVNSNVEYWDIEGIKVIKRKV